MKLYVDQQLLINDVDVANSYFKRLRGMIRRPISALYIPRCNSIHTFFMHKPIDVLFLNKQLKILYIARNVDPRKIRTYKKAAHVLELDVNLVDQLGLYEGQQVSFMA